MSHSQAHTLKRTAHAKQAQYEGRTRRNALRRKIPIETTPSPRIHQRKRKGWLAKIIKALKRIIGR